MGWLARLFGGEQAPVTIDPGLREWARQQQAARAQGGGTATAVETKPAAAAEARPTPPEPPARMAAGGMVKVAAPAVGFFNLKGAEGANMSKHDREGLGPMFKACRVSSGAVPKCDVLFVYCDLDAAGNVAGSPKGLKELVMESGACVAVVASENPEENYAKAMEAKGDSGANLVLTLDRKGDTLADFFEKVFAGMFVGGTMFKVWEELAPRMEGYDHPDAPRAIVLAGLGDVAFAK